MAGAKKRRSDNYTVVCELDKGDTDPAHWRAQLRNHCVELPQLADDLGDFDGCVTFMWRNDPTGDGQRLVTLGVVDDRAGNIVDALGCGVAQVISNLMRDSDDDAALAGEMIGRVTVKVLEAYNELNP